MIHPQHAAMIEKLKKDLKAGNMTPTDKVGPGTFLCMTQATPMGMLYHQLPFDSAPLDIAAILNGKTKGYKLGDLKVVAIFDMWPEMEVKQAPPVEVLDN